MANSSIVNYPDSDDDDHSGLRRGQTGGNTRFLPTQLRTGGRFSRHQHDQQRQSQTYQQQRSFSREPPKSSSSGGSKTVGYKGHSSETVNIQSMQDMINYMHQLQSEDLPKRLDKSHEREKSYNRQTPSQNRSTESKWKQYKSEKAAEISHPEKFQSAQAGWKKLKSENRWSASLWNTSQVENEDEDSRDSFSERTVDIFQDSPPRSKPRQKTFWERQETENEDYAQDRRIVQKSDDKSDDLFDEIFTHSSGDDKSSRHKGISPQNEQYVQQKLDEALYEEEILRSRRVLEEAKRAMMDDIGDDNIEKAGNSFGERDHIFGANPEPPSDYFNYREGEVKTSIGMGDSEIHRISDEKYNRTDVNSAYDQSSYYRRSSREDNYRMPDNVTQPHDHSEDKNYTYQREIIRSSPKYRRESFEEVLDNRNKSPVKEEESWSRSITIDKPSERIESRKMDRSPSSSMNPIRRSRSRERNRRSESRSGSSDSSSSSSSSGSSTSSKSPSPKKKKEEDPVPIIRNPYDNPYLNIQTINKYYHELMEWNYSHRCLICDKIFEDMKQWTDHIKNTKHGKEFHLDPPRCTPCHLYFNTEKEWSMHMAFSNYHGFMGSINVPKPGTVLPVDPSYPILQGWRCKGCNVISVNSEAAVTHIKMTHLIHTAMFPCPLCGVPFWYQQDLDQHADSVHAPPKFLCEMCERSFESEEKLSTHKLIKHSRKLLCYKCDKEIDEIVFKEHTEMHKLESMLSCKVCGYLFHDRNLLDRHMRYAHSNRRKDSHRRRRHSSESSSDWSTWSSDSSSGKSKRKSKKDEDNRIVRKEYAKEKSRPETKKPRTEEKQVLSKSEEIKRRQGDSSIPSSECASPTHFESDIAPPGDEDYKVPKKDTYLIKDEDYKISEKKTEEKSSSKIRTKDVSSDRRDSKKEKKSETIQSRKRSYRSKSRSVERHRRRSRYSRSRSRSRERYRHDRRSRSRRRSKSPRSKSPRNKSPRRRKSSRSKSPRKSRSPGSKSRRKSKSPVSRSHHSRQRRSRSASRGHSSSSRRRHSRDVKSKSPRRKSESKEYRGKPSFSKTTVAPKLNLSIEQKQVDIDAERLIEKQIEEAFRGTISSTNTKELVDEEKTNERNNCKAEETIIKPDNENSNITDTYREKIIDEWNIESEKSPERIVSMKPKDAVTDTIEKVESSTHKEKDQPPSVDVEPVPNSTWIVQGKDIPEPKHKRDEDDSGDDESKKIVCKECSKTFKSLTQLRDHFTVKHKKPTVPRFKKTSESTPEVKEECPDYTDMILRSKEFLEEKQLKEIKSSEVKDTTEDSAKDILETDDMEVSEGSGEEDSNLPPVPGEENNSGKSNVTHNDSVQSSRHAGILENHADIDLGAEQTNLEPVVEEVRDPNDGGICLEDSSQQLHEVNIDEAVDNSDGKMSSLYELDKDSVSVAEDEGHGGALPQDVHQASHDDGSIESTAESVCDQPSENSMVDNTINADGQSSMSDSIGQFQLGSSEMDKPEKELPDAPASTSKVPKGKKKPVSGHGAKRMTRASIKKAQMTEDEKLIAKIIDEIE